MIQQTEVMPFLIEGCPSFSDAWAEHVCEYGNDLLYVAAARFASHLFSLYESEQFPLLVAAGEVIEQLHVNGSPWVKEFATVGILEAIQNVCSRSNTDPECFRQFLGPESQRWWSGLYKFWSGQMSHVQADD
jgi:hypothetical protein